MKREGGKGGEGKGYREKGSEIGEGVKDMDKEEGEGGIGIERGSGRGEMLWTYRKR